MGAVTRVNGPLVDVAGLRGVAMSEVVELGAARLPSEVVTIRGEHTTVQAYEYTGGLRPGDPARALGRALSARLGPGLLGGVFDGLLRPLADAPTWLLPGARRAGTGRRWRFEPAVVAGTAVGPGDVLGVVPGAGAVPHRVLVPHGTTGAVTDLVDAGEYTDTEVIARVGQAPIALAVDWPVRRPRPFAQRLDEPTPLVTGQRVLDVLFPVARGSSAAVPGGFGTGKTMLLQQIAKWCDADVIVYVGCGERGNEMADVVADLADLDDPRTGGRLLDRTVIIANTSNMPMMARETSVYTGATVAEYYRDMGHHAVVIADSTSRWAEALREFASRSGALPAEEGYPADLASALAAFYERAGAVTALGGRRGSVTMIGAVSPAGGDFTEPVTAHTQRFVRCLWALDRDLAYARHYPAVGWADSFSRDADPLARWHARDGDAEWTGRRARVAALLAEADRLAAVADLVGVSTMPGHERMVLLGGRLMREGVLQQNALSEADAFCTEGKSAALVDMVLAVVARCEALVADGVPAAGIEELDLSPVLRAREEAGPSDADAVHRHRDAGPVGAAVSAAFPVEFGDVHEVRGPLLVVRGVHGVGWDEFATIRLGSGEPRHGLVLEVDRDLAVVQVLEGTDGLRPRDTGVTFVGEPLRVPVGEGWLGRVCNGRGEPRDDGPPVFGEATAAVAGLPLNPVARRTPAEPVLTGVSAVDALTTLVRGQKLPVFSPPGLPHLELAAQIAAQASTGGEPFSVVFAAMGLTHSDAAAVRDRLEERSAAGELVLLLNTADDPVIERILTPRIALTVAEYLAFHTDRHVLVVMADMTSYAEALREVSAARGEIPARRAYPGYLYSDLASLYERCGRIAGSTGSVTVLPVLTMPAGDITHPVPDLTGYITEGQIVLSTEVHARGIYPPVDALSSLSRLMRKGAGPGRTRDDHLDLAAQLLAALAGARQARELAELVGAGALSGTDRRYLDFADAFETRLINQGPDERRTLDETLARAWDAASVLPRRELTMLPGKQIDAHYTGIDPGSPHTAEGAAR